MPSILLALFTFRKLRLFNSVAGPTKSVQMQKLQQEFERPSVRRRIPCIAIVPVDRRRQRRTVTTTTLSVPVARRTSNENNYQYNVAGVARY
jgi:hypothetical protein